MKIGLGTVQFGLNYGVGNRQGKTSVDMVRQMLNLAADRGVEVLDTAALYGSSEEVLGQCGAAGRFKIVTKTPQFKKSEITLRDADELERTFHESLRKLKCDSVEGLLLHNCIDALTPGGDLLIQRLLDLQRRGYVAKVGVSSYHPEQVREILNWASISLVQVPFNVFDQRFLRTGLFAELKQRHIEIHTRSAFLQGSLLMPPDELPQDLQRFRASFDAFLSIVGAHKCSSLGMALGFVLGCELVDAIVVGACSVAELSEIFDAAAAPPKAAAELQQLASTDESLINPSQWSGVMATR